MEAFHTMRILLESVLDTDRVHQVNVRVAQNKKPPAGLPAALG
jgi:hypothetical protein